MITKRSPATPRFVIAHESDQHSREFEIYLCAWLVKNKQQIPQWLRARNPWLNK